MIKRIVSIYLGIVLLILERKNQMFLTAEGTEVSIFTIGIFYFIFISSYLVKELGHYVYNY